MVQNKLKSLPGTPLGPNKENKSPSMKKEIQTNGVKVDTLMDNEKKSKMIAERKASDLQTLFVKVSRPNAEDTHAELIKNFSKKCKEIRVHKKMKYAFYVEFGSPETMEANKEAVESIKVNGEQVFVDYVGEKSHNPPNKQTVLKELNYKKLFVTNYTKTITKQDVQEAFKGCSDVDMASNHSKVSRKRFCFVYFDDESSAKQAFEMSSSIELEGRVPHVRYAYAISQKRKKSKLASDSPTKKQKVEVPAVIKDEPVKQVKENAKKRRQRRKARTIKKEEESNEKIEGVNQVKENSKKRRQRRKAGTIKTEEEFYEEIEGVKQVKENARKAGTIKKEEESNEKMEGVKQVKENAKKRRQRRKTGTIKKEEESNEKMVGVKQVKENARKRQRRKAGTN